VSEVAEIAGGMDCRSPRFAAATYELADLLVAVFPANVYVAMTHVQIAGVIGKSCVQWLRLPLQIPIFLWALH
jgi:uncharacterized membrane protein